MYGIYICKLCLCVHFSHFPFLISLLQYHRQNGRIGEKKSENQSRISAVVGARDHAAAATGSSAQFPLILTARVAEHDWRLNFWRASFYSGRSRRWAPKPIAEWAPIGAEWSRSGRRTTNTKTHVIHDVATAAWRRGHLAFAFAFAFALPGPCVVQISRRTICTIVCVYMASASLARHRLCRSQVIMWDPRIPRRLPALRLPPSTPSAPVAQTCREHQQVVVVVPSPSHMIDTALGEVERRGGRVFCVLQTKTPMSLNEQRSMWLCVCVWMCVGSRGKVKAKSLTYKCALIHTYMCVRVCLQYAGPAGVDSIVR